MKQLLAAALTLAGGFAQPLKTAEFEVASLKYHAAPTPMTLPVMKGGPGTSSPERIRYSNVTLMNLITKAHGVYPDQVVGPSWLISEIYTLDAVLPPGTTQEQLAEMLRNLLAQRFNLVLAHEQKEFTVYHLVTAQDGSRLKRSPAPDQQSDRADDEPSPPSSPPDKVDGQGCPAVRPGVRNSAGTTRCTAFRTFSMADFIRVLEMMVAFETGSFFNSQASGAHIVDRTGLDGEFDFNLIYDVASRFPAPQRLGANAPGIGDGPSIFAAIQNQLGLRLEKTRAPLTVLNIQHVVKVPAPN